MKRVFNFNQAGLALIIELVVVAIILIGVGGVGYATYKARQHTTAISIHGTIKQKECSQTGANCSTTTLSGDNGKSYSLNGPADAKPYVGKAVTVKGTLTTPPPVEAINVVTVQPDPPQAPPPAVQNGDNGILSGSVYCSQKISKQPCASTIKLETADSSGGVTSTSQTVTTDAQGHFSISLSPNSYYITPSPKSDYPLVNVSSSPVFVAKGQSFEVEVDYMDGRR